MAGNIVLLSVILSVPYSCSLVIPFPWQAALMARYVVHKTDWVAVATTSTAKGTNGYPFVNLLSMSDGPVINGTGIPYVYMTNMDTIGQDIQKDNRCTMMTTLAETSYCENQNYDAEDPRCVRIFLTGRLVRVNNNTDEFNFSKNALFSRHPIMKTWPTDHQFYIAKLNIENIGVFDYFGGIKHVSVKDYFNASDFEFPSKSVAVVDVVGRK